MKNIEKNIRQYWWVTFILLTTCVDKIYFDAPPANSLLIVEGTISDATGPYVVKVSEGFNLDIADSTVHRPVSGVNITLFDDEGNSESLHEIATGEYATSGIIQGKVGHSYHVELKTQDGRVFESEPDKIMPVGKIDTINYEFEYRVGEVDFGKHEADVFNIYLDSKAGVDSDTYVRWRYTGIYKVATRPELHVTFLQVSTYMTPLPCSGYIVVPALGGGKLEKVAECTCCICWARLYEDKPQLSDVQLVTNNQFKHVKVGEVPVNGNTFYDKFQVVVEQMSLTRKAYDFFKLIRVQKDGASNLFQPPSGELKGNIKATNSNSPVVGLFWATSISTKAIYIQPGALPYAPPPINFSFDACYDYFPNASTIQPKFWE